MEWKKAKGLVISVLLMANLFLLLNLGSMVRARQSQQYEKIDKAVEILRQSGIEIEGDGARKLPPQVYSYYRARDYEKEREMANAVLGPCLKQSPGGGIEEYASDVGKMVFRSGGAFSLEVYGLDASQNLNVIAQDTLRVGDIFTGNLLSRTGEKPGEKDLALFGEYMIDGKYVIEDYQINVAQTTKGLSFQGKLFDEKTAVKSDIKWDGAEMLLSLLKLLDNESAVRINELDVVYMVKTISATENIFLPYLKVNTSIGVVYISSETKEMVWQK